MITNLGFHGLVAEKYMVADMPFLIMINGKNATNAAAARERGLQLTVDPTGGLSTGKGQQLRLTGPDVSEAGNTSVTIVGNLKDGSQMVLYTRLL